MLDLLKLILGAAYDIGGLAGAGAIILIFLTLLMYFISGRENRSVIKDRTIPCNSTEMDR